MFDALTLPLRERWLRLPSGVFGQAGWVSTAYFAQQVLRLATNIVLARLLAPELFGIMLIINTLRTGSELLTDVGIGQGIVRHPEGDQPRYFNTAWTVQILRGIVLFLVAVAAAGPVAALYEEPVLAKLIPVFATIFLITGLSSPSRFLLQKRMEVRKLTLFELGATLVQSLVTIGLAWIVPGIWALVWGMLIGSGCAALASFFLIDWRRHRLTLDREALRSIVGFGKWVFLASLLYFLASYYDWLYLGKAIPFALLGVYGIARTYSDTATQLFQRLGTLIVFPKVAAHAERGAGLGRAIAPKRRLALGAIALSLGAGVAVADTMIELFYDARYHQAGAILTLLLVGVWFAILAAMADAMMMGVGAPSGVALGNAVKFGCMVVGLPLALAGGGLLAVVLVLIVADALRYVTLAARKRSHGLSFLRQDIVFTAIFGATAIGLRVLTGLVGLTGGLEGWIAAGSRLGG